MNQRLKILVKGVVQGVGFRPFVYNLAKSLNLRGYVNNSSKGVTVEIEGENTSAFVDRLTRDAPPLSQILSVDTVELPYHGYQDFQIVESEDEGSFTLVSADVSVCKDCFREMLDKNDRRYLYPFINCTNCGPRYTITKSIPYDRPNTTMAIFKMCPDCDREYHDPSDRRFHAQPNACPVCGPQVELIVKREAHSLSKKIRGKNKVHPPLIPPLEGGIIPSPLRGEGKGEGELLHNEESVGEAIRLLKEGHIVAIKGLGGFHIACDATNEEAVKKLRLKKRKSNKPFALMAPDVETIRKFCEVSQEEETLLLSNKRPIVLLRKLTNHLPEEVSPNNPCIGFMLPYTPLHYLLFHYPVDEEREKYDTDNSPSPPFSKGGNQGGVFSKVGDSGGIFSKEGMKKVTRRKEKRMEGLTHRTGGDILSPPLVRLGRRDTGGFLNEQSSFIPNFEALVMTSGNISEEPIVIDNEEAVAKLSGIADAFLIHNRDIFMRVDDSVVRVFTRNVIPRPPIGVEGRLDRGIQKTLYCPVKSANDKPFKSSFALNNQQFLGDSQDEKSSSVASQPITYFIRRSRGFVPDPVQLRDDGPEVLGCGADIKNVFTLTKGSFAIPSQHIGDMENYETLKFFEESLENLKAVYRATPEALAYDLHPMYLSTQWALKQNGMKKFGIQHHYAHVASVMAEKGIKEKVIGVSFDGTGYGTDGSLWGGEFLIADIWGFKRAGHLKYVPLPGGETSVREPWRIAASYIRDVAGEEAMSYLESIGFIERYGDERIRDLLKIINNRQFSPLSSGAGRLFDGISAMIGICSHNTFEGEAAIALEAVTAPDIIHDYPVDIKFRETMEVDFSRTILGILDDLKRGERKSIISSKFHNTIITAVIRVVEKLASLHQINDIVLCGGVFQNMYLLERTIDRLKSTGLRVLIHDKVPTNDAGISLGQAYIIRERIKAGIE